MARSFSVSAIFTAVNRLSAPVAAMGRQISQFASSVRTSSRFAGSSLAGVAADANRAALSISNALNSITFSRLQQRLSQLRSQLRQAASGINNAGNNIAGFGASGVAAGYGLNKTLDAVREKEAVQGSLGIEYTKDNKSMTPAERMRVGQEQYARTAELATKLPGSVETVGLLRALMHRKGVEGNMENITGLTNLLTGMGKGTLDHEALSAFQSTLTGNQSDLMERVGLKLHTEDGKISYRKDDGTEVKFKNFTDQLKYLIDYGTKNFPDATKIAMSSTAGVESNLGDAAATASVSTWENSGGLKLYKDTVQELTKALSDLTPKMTDVIKPAVEFFKANDKIFKGILIGVPGLIVLGAALKVLAVSLSGFSILLSPVGLAIAAMGAAALIAFKDFDSFKSVLPTFEQLKNAIESIRNIFLNGISAIKQWASEHQRLIKFVGGFIAAFAGMSAIVAVVTGFVTVISSLPAIIGGIGILLTGLSLPMVAIAAAAGLIYANWDIIAPAITKSVNAVTNFGGSIGTMVFDCINYLNNLGATIGTAIFDGVQLAKEYFNKFKIWLLTPIDFTPLFDALAKVFNIVIEKIKSLWQEFKTWMLTPIDFSALFRNLTEAFNSAVSSIKSTWQSLNLSTPAVPKLQPQSTPASSAINKTFMQPTAYQPPVNVHINQQNMHNVSSTGHVQTTTKNNINGGRLVYNNNANTGQSRRTQLLNNQQHVFA